MGKHIEKIRRREKGLCWDCNKPAEQGYSRCLFHRYMDSMRWRDYYKKHSDKRKAKAKAERERYIELGLCIRCGRPKMNDALTCNECIERGPSGTIRT